MWAAPAFRERLGDFDATNTGAVFRFKAKTIFRSYLSYH
ncbi:hypothetical protein AC80_0666 [Escherichia coli 1-110-08_S4_C1]|nr:hypothetical protein AC80_0666 [Escherichia coli 1-110-08_S4_C1]